MSTITRRFLVTAVRDSRSTEIIPLGRAVEWDGESIQVELNTLPVGNWWGGVATLREDGQAPSGEPAITRQFDLVAGKRGIGPEAKTLWIKVGTAMELAGEIRLDVTSTPAGAWWDGKLRLFIQKDRPRRSKPEHTDAR